MAPPPVVVIQSANDFRAPLATYGRWVVVAGYGSCWLPEGVAVDWRPYSDGSWQRTDAGWYWASAEPWGWATYHYGRWDWNLQLGWFWVPQTQWAPAWVTWREGGGYVGWAPLRPPLTAGVSFSSSPYEPKFASRAFVFVEHRRLLEPVRPRTVVVNNATIINQTVNITKVRIVNKTVINEGPRPDVIERETGRRISPVAASEFRHREEAEMLARERERPRAGDRKIQSQASAEIHPTPPTRIEELNPRQGSPSARSSSNRPVAHSPGPATGATAKPSPAPAAASHLPHRERGLAESVNRPVSPPARITPRADAKPVQKRIAERTVRPEPRSQTANPGRTGATPRNRPSSQTVQMSPGMQSRSPDRGEMHPNKSDPGRFVANSP